MGRPAQGRSVERRGEQGSRVPYLQHALLDPDLLDLGARAALERHRAAGLQSGLRLPLAHSVVVVVGPLAAVDTGLGSRALDVRECELLRHAVAHHLLRAPLAHAALEAHAFARHIRGLGVEPDVANQPPVAAADVRLQESCVGVHAHSFYLLARDGALQHHALVLAAVVLRLEDAVVQLRQRARAARQVVNRVVRRVRRRAPPPRADSIEAHLPARHPRGLHSEAIVADVAPLRVGADLGLQQACWCASRSGGGHWVGGHRTRKRTRRGLGRHAYGMGHPRERTGRS